MITLFIWLAGAVLLFVGSLTLYAWFLSRIGAPIDWTPPPAHEIDEVLWERAKRYSAKQYDQRSFDPIAKAMARAADAQEAA